MRRVVVIGSKGQLGSDLVRALGQPDRVVPLSHQDLEICDHSRAREVLTRLRPDTVINTAAYHRVDDCEDHESKAFETNAGAILNLGRICNGLDALLVHVSTDYVFGGDGRPDHALHGGRSAFPLERLWSLQAGWRKPASKRVPEAPDRQNLGALRSERKP